MMQHSLFGPAPGFEQPIAVLKHCHDRIRKQIVTLQKLLPHLQEYGADLEAQQAAHAVLRYFNDAAPLHHQDEEDDLLPLLETTATGDDAMQLHDTLPKILGDHQEMEILWTKLNRQLGAIATAQSTQLSDADVARFAVLYHAHMQLEETVIAPMAKRIFSQEQTRQLGDAMRVRRGLSNT